MCCVEDRKIHSNSDNSFVRKNGWTLPLNCLQVVAWFVLLYIGFMFFGVIAIAVDKQLWPLAYVCIGVFYVIHVVCFLISTSINPSDENSLKKLNTRNTPLPVFNRSAHPHVIEDSYCHICEVPVGKLSKHCSACNKCVAVFDHHCKWLNNCIGEKNYRIFLATLLSAILGCVGMLAISLFVFINAVQGFNSLNKGVWWHATTSLEVAFEVLVGLDIFILLLTVGLLLQLFSFHAMLISKGMTTYEYVKKAQSDREARKLEKERRNSFQSDPDTSAVCQNMPDVIESPRQTDISVIEDVCTNMKAEALPKHALIKPNGSKGLPDINKQANSNGLSHLLQSKGDFQNGSMVAHNHLSSSDDRHANETKPLSSTLNASFEQKSADKPHLLPNYISDHKEVSDLNKPMKRKRRRKKVSISLEGVPPRPLPEPNFTAVQSQSPSVPNSYDPFHLPLLRDPTEAPENSRKLAKKKQLLPLSTSDSAASVTSSTYSEI